MKSGHLAEWRDDKEIALELEGRLGKMLQTIEFSDEESDLLKLKNGAMKWLWGKAIQNAFHKALEKSQEKGQDFPERKQEEMKATFTELMSNSSSACEEDDRLSVEVGFYVGKKGLVIHVKDEGPGFNVAAEVNSRRQNDRGLTEDSVLYEKMLSDYPGGTGIYCLLHFAQAFQYNEKGNEVIVMFTHT